MGDLAAILAVFGGLAVTNLVHMRIVTDDAYERQVIAYAGFEVPSGEAKRAVAEEADDFLLGAGHLRRHGKRLSDAEGAQRARIHPMARSLRLNDAARERY